MPKIDISRSLALGLSNSLLVNFLMNVDYRYKLYGLEISSQLKLPSVSLQMNSEQKSSTPDVAVKYGTVEKSLSNPNIQAERFEAAENVLLVKNPNVGRYLIRNGREILVDPLPDVPMRKLTAFLMGSAFGALLHQRGFLPLHACTVRVGEGSVAFVGHSTAGKSTLGAGLRQAGYTLLSDDVCALKIQSGMPPMSVSGSCQIKLCPDAGERLKIENFATSPLGLKQKRLIPGNPNGDSFEVPLRAIYVLEWDHDNPIPYLSEVQHADKFPLLKAHTYRYPYLKGLGLLGQHFADTSELLRTTSIFTLNRNQDFTQFPLTIDLLSRHWESRFEVSSESVSRKFPA